MNENSLNRNDINKNYDQNYNREQVILFSETKNRKYQKLKSKKEEKV